MKRPLAFTGLSNASAVAIVVALFALPAAAQEAPAADAPAAAAPAADASAADVDAAAAAAAAEAPPETGKSATDEGIDLTLQDRIKAVSRKTFLKQGRFELDPGFMVTTNDPFFRTWSLAGRAAYHVNDSFAVELGGAWVPPFFVEELPAIDVLREQASLINASARLNGLVDVGVTFSPIYGKIAVLSDAIIHFDTFAIAGIGAVFDTNGNILDAKNFGDPIHPAMDIGAGVRVFLLRWFVLRADLRDYLYPQDRSGISTLQNLMMLNIGVGFFIPTDFDYRYEAAKVNG